jgi:hypothetical protein
MRRLRGTSSIEREKVLEFKYECLQHLLRGVLTEAKLLDFPKVRKAFVYYLQSIGLHPNDDSVLEWLQENTGDRVAAFILEQDDGKIDFLVTTGTHAELRQIGMNHVEESNDSQGTPRVRQVHVGERTGAKESGRVQAGQQGRPSLYD